MSNIELMQCTEGELEAQIDMTDIDSMIQTWKKQLLQPKRSSVLQNHNDGYGDAPTKWAMFPDDIVYLIFSTLPFDSLLLCMRVCKHWHMLIKKSRGLWQDIVIEDAAAVITTSDFRLYISRAGNNGIHTLSLARPVGLFSLDTNEAINILLQHGVYNLRHLDISCWRLLSTPTILRLFEAANRTLKHLNISYINNGDEILAHVVSKCQKLKYLECHGCYPVTNTIKSATLASLKTFVWSGKVSPQQSIVSLIRPFPNLENASFDCSCRQISLRIGEFILRLPKIKRLDVHIYSRLHYIRRYVNPPGPLDEAALRQVTSNSRYLEYLSFSSFLDTDACDAQIKAVLDGCSSQLQGLKLSRSSISDKTMLFISVTSLPQLKELKLANCRRISGESLVAAIRACPNLQSLELLYVPAVGDQLLEVLGQCSNLESVNIGFSDNLTGTAVRLLLDESLSLRRLRMIGCRNVDSDALRDPNSMWKNDFANGNEAFQRSQFKAAYQHFSSSLLQDPGNIVILDCRAAASEKLGRYKDVLQDARLMVKSEPTKARGYIRMVKALNALKQKDKAQQIVHIALKRIPVDDKLYPSLKRLKTSNEIFKPTKNYWPLLPTELIGSIFSFLTLQDRANCLRVCRHWYHFMTDEPIIWRTIEVETWSPITIKTLRRYIRYADPLGLRQIVVSRDWPKHHKVMSLLLSCNLSALQHLRLKLYNISEDDLRELVKKVQNSLRYLDIPLSDTMTHAYEFLDACQNLEELRCFDCTMESNPRDYFKMNSSLKTLVWHGTCEHGDQLLTFVQQLPNLNTLHVELYRCYADDTIISPSDLVLGLPFLHTLSIKLPRNRFPSQFTEDKSAKIQKHASNLQSLCLECRFEDWELKAILEGCASTILSLSLDNFHVSDQALVHMSTLPLDRLQRLRIYNCHLQDSQALELLIKACPELRLIALCNINVTDDRCLRALGICEKLEHVDIQNSPEVTGSGIRSLVAGHPALSSLAAYSCPRIDLDAIQYAESILGSSRCRFGSCPNQ